MGLEVLYCSAHVLFCRAYPVEPTHHMVGFVRIGGHPPFVQIWCEGAEARCGEALAHPTDLLIEPPPFLDDHDVFCTAGRLCQITRDRTAKRDCILDSLAHWLSSSRCLDGNVWLPRAVEPVSLVVGSG